MGRGKGFQPSTEAAVQRRELDITAIVISYNSEGRIGAAIASHEKALSEFEHEVIVVDNASADRSVAEARAALVGGRVIANEENVGYGHAANQALRVARGHACLILNDDAYLDADAVKLLHGELYRSEEVALVGPRIVDQEGRPMPSARTVFPGLREEALRIWDLSRGINSNSDYPTSSQDPTDVAWLVAACILGKTDILCDVGGFNPAFFLYSEDIDLARRLNLNGYRVLTVPAAVCTHIGSVSTGEHFGNQASMRRRTAARDVYYRIWLSRPERSLVHARRALGVKHQPARLLYHLPKVFWDGRSLEHLRRLPPLELQIDDPTS